MTSINMFMLCYIMHQDVFTYVTPVRNGHEKMFKFQHRHCVNIQNKVIRLLNEFKFKDRRFQVLYQLLGTMGAKVSQEYYDD